MHSKKVINNSLISFFYRIVILILGFFTRKIFIIYLGEEVLGLNSLYSNLLDLLNLAELGIGVAVQFQLYEPLVNNDRLKLSKIISAARKIYNFIGCFIAVMGLLLTPFIHYFIKETTFPMWFVRCSFLISVSGISLSYFFVHEKLFLLADEENGLVNIIELIAKIFIIIISLISTVIFKNYFVYLAINALYWLIVNVIIHFIFRKKYPQVLSNIKDNKEEIKDLTSNLKNVVPMKLSNYVYNSTDNVIISKVIGLTTVALYSNYMTIINGIMGMEYLMGNIIMASMGKKINELQNPKRLYKYYLLYQYAQFIFTNFATVILTLVCSPFITIWIGEKYVVNNCIFALLVIDFYIHSMYQPAYVMYGATGQFKNDKIITGISAVLNIVFSIILVNFIGLSGVIIGTIITDIYIWFVRTYQMIRKYFDENIIKYAIKMIVYILSTLISVFVSLIISNNIVCHSIFVDIIVKIFISFFVSAIIVFLITYRDSDTKELFKYIKKYVKRG